MEERLIKFQGDNGHEWTSTISEYIKVNKDSIDDEEYFFLTRIPVNQSIIVPFGQGHGKITRIK